MTPNNLPAIPDQPNNLPAPHQGTNYFYYDESQHEEPTPLSHYLWILKRHKYRIIAFVAFAVAATIIVSSRITPIYESTATVDIDRRAPTGVLGQESQMATINDADQFLATQVKIIQSDSVLRPVVQKYHPEKIDNTLLDQPQLPTVNQEDAPVLLKRLKVTRPPNTYLLQIAYRHTDPRMASEVANAVASSYVLHTYNIRINSSLGLASFMEKQLEELKAKMEKSSAALIAFEKELNVINPEEKTSILSARLLQLNTEFTNAQSDRVKKEVAYESVRAGSMDAALASAQGDSIRKLTERLDEANEKFAQVQTHYGANHPEHRKAASLVAELQSQIERSRKDITGRSNVEYTEALKRETLIKKALAETKAEFDRLNARSFEYKQLKQEAETDKKLYEELVRKIREAGINAGFQNSSIRLADAARPALKPVYPKLQLNAILAFLFSTLLAVGAAVMSDVLDSTVRDPEQVSRMNSQVIGSLPVVRAWHRHKLMPAQQNGTKALAKSDHNRRYSPVSGFEEAIRTLRDSILLSNNHIRSLLVTSATPREGKSTTAAYLALAHASQKRKTLLIDGDLRRPGVHTKLGLTNDAKGLSEVILEEANWRDCLTEAPGHPELNLLLAGKASRHAADRIGTVLKSILEEAADDFDLVVVDSPPLLGFAEPLQMAALTDGTVVVTKAGQTHRNALQSVLTALNRLKTNVVGVALNEVREDMSDRYYYYGYYGKYYSQYYR